ncbi:hypothetical protein RB653_006913 [Dictyostelium firmibasis]|uniref:Uncharacterized protein n=1 Tax=Dictyostelium firmibasis TaxID=79012 RepID=A0AAN7YLL6_9MYCE
MSGICGSFGSVALSYQSCILTVVNKAIDYNLDSRYSTTPKSVMLFLNHQNHSQRLKHLENMSIQRIHVFMTPQFFTESTIQDYQGGKVLPCSIDFTCVELIHDTLRKLSSGGGGGGGLNNLLPAADEDDDVPTNSQPSLNSTQPTNVEFEPEISYTATPRLSNVVGVNVPVNQHPISNQIPNWYTCRHDPCNGRFSDTGYRNKHDKSLELHHNRCTPNCHSDYNKLAKTYQIGEYSFNIVAVDQYDEGDELDLGFQDVYDSDADDEYQNENIIQVLDFVEYQCTLNNNIIPYIKDEEVEWVNKQKINTLINGEKLLVEIESLCGDRGQITIKLTDFAFNNEGNNVEHFF